MIPGKEKVPFRTVICPSCGKRLGDVRSERPFRAESRDPDHEEKYDVVTRCPRCREWVGAYKIPKNRVGQTKDRQQNTA